MILRRGITGFFKFDPLDEIPEFSYPEFKRIVFGTGTSQGFAISSLSKAGATPNFHKALIECDRGAMLILGNATYPVFAFSEPFSDSSLRLKFVDDRTIAAEIVRLFPIVNVAFAEQLHRKLSDVDLSQLDVVEIEQIEYWKPDTVGEVVFNWWD